MYRLATVVGVSGCLMFLSLVGGCESSPKVMADEQRFHSTVLMDALPAVLSDAMMARQQVGLALPPDHESEEFTDSVIQTLMEQYPDLLLVSGAEEDRFQVGQFDDEGNAQRLTELLEQAHAHNASLNTIASYLAARYEMGTLEGVRLELAVRLVNAQVQAAMMSSLTGGE